MVLGTALASVAKFVWHCRTHGWSTKPAYMAHIASALRGAGWAPTDISKFCLTFALDMGGMGPMGPEWSRK